LSDPSTVYADFRWPDRSGIGVVKNEILRRAQERHRVKDLNVRGRIGSPFSPLAIALALNRAESEAGVFWSPGFMPPAYCRLPSVLQVHDLIHLRFYSKAHVAYYNAILRPLYRRCSKIVCSSENTRREFLEWSGMPAEKVVTIYLGVSESFRASAMPSPLAFPYVFYPGNHRPYKNSARLIDAYANSSLPANGIRLVFTGPPQKELVLRAQLRGIPNSVHFVGQVPEIELVRLYQGALLIAFVSMYEGFGLPIVEAMCAGVPILTSNTSSMPEVAGDAALLIDPSSTEQITQGLEVLASDTAKRADLIARGNARSKLFSWDTTAAQLWAQIDSVTQ
jgi:glycosyltransferase involved in cell wall biosynthesis